VISTQLLVYLAESSASLLRKTVETLKIFVTWIDRTRSSSHVAPSFIWPWLFSTCLPFHGRKKNLSGIPWPADMYVTLAKGSVSLSLLIFPFFLTKKKKKISLDQILHSFAFIPLHNKVLAEFTLSQSLLQHSSLCRSFRQDREHMIFSTETINQAGKRHQPIYCTSR
jgi:hypothetical protein